MWFNDNAEEAVKFYTSVFRKSKILKVARYGEAGAQVSGMKKGTVMTINFKIEGMEFVAINGGPIFKFTPAISLMVNCKTQKEIDTLWRKLSANPAAEQCGWLEDKFGVSWQIVPHQLEKMMVDKNERKREAAMKAMLKMKKLDLAVLKTVYKSA